MKILFLSNFFPPHHIGGYGMLCKEVAEGLISHQHTFKVLTSTFGVDSPTIDGDVHRLLELESDIHFYKPGQALLYPQAKRRNLQHFHQLVSAYQPDLVFIWGMWCLMKELAAEAEKTLGSRVAYYLANPWPIEGNMHQAYWDMPAKRRFHRYAKAIVRLPARQYLGAEWRPVSLRFEHAPCCSSALKRQLIDADVPLMDAPVIYEGIKLAPYLDQVSVRTNSNKLRLLFVGILATHKGVHTIIEALSLLAPPKLAQVSLTILGSGHPDYEEYLQELVRQHKLGDFVTFHSPIPRDDLPNFMGQHDVLLLPSTWEEPLARIMQEGLASSMVVVGSATGGTKEIIMDGKNGLLFPPGDAQKLADAVVRLIDDSDLGQRLAQNGKQAAEELFDIGRMVHEIDLYLREIIESSPLSAYR